MRKRKEVCRFIFLCSSKCASYMSALWCLFLCSSKCASYMSALWCIFKALIDGNVCENNNNVTNQSPLMSTYHQVLSYNSSVHILQQMIEAKRLWLQHVMFGEGTCGYKFKYVVGSSLISWSLCLLKSSYRAVVIVFARISVLDHMKEKLPDVDKEMIEVALSVANYDQTRAVQLLQLEVNK